MNLTRLNWPAGWQPAYDDVNGDPNGLIRMDNLTLDNKGAVRLVRGLKQIDIDFSTYVDRIFSKNINGQEYLWISCGPIGQYNYRGINTFTLFGEGTNRSFWIDALGSVLLLAGRLRLKDKDGVSSPLPLGLVTAGVPTIMGVDQTVKTLSGMFSAIQGTSIGADTFSIYIQADQQASQAVAVCVLPTLTDTLDLGDGPAQLPDNDYIAFEVTPDDTSTISSIQVDFVVGAYDATNITDYFTYQVDLTLLLQGQSQRSVINPFRSEFTRVGSSNLGWESISAIRFTYKTTSWNSCSFGDITIIGGSQGQLNGSYTYIAQCVNDNGQYQAIGPCSTPTGVVTVYNGRITVSPGTIDVQQCNQIWIFRGGGTLDQYYRVGIITPGQTFTDTVTDQDALVLDYILNPFLLSLAPLDDGNGIVDDIFCAEGLLYGRMLYMTEKYLYLSDTLNPDAIDSRYTLKASGDPSEINLWVKKLTNNVVMLGTNKNLYEITGTLSPLPDGTIDAAINPIGEQYPPISADVAAAEATLYYMGADGIRLTQGSNSNLLSAALRLLFEGDTRYGIAPVVINQYANYAMAAGHGRLYASIPTSDGKTYLWIWDAINSYWRLQYTDPVCVYITVSGRILVGYNLSTNILLAGGLFQLDSGLGLQDSSGTFLEGQPFTLQTVYDSNGQPRNRKDTFTLKVIADTSGDDVDCYLGVDGKTFQFVGRINSAALETFYFPINQFSLGFRYAVQLLDHNLVTDFTLYECTIEYDPRPEQNVYMRIQPNNLGTESRKRFVSYAFVIDTLGNNVNFQPIVNGAFIGSPVVVNTIVKQTFIYYFQSEVIGTDISGILSGGIFEFYQVQLDEIISEKMPAPVEYLVIPNNNYGTPNRKRFSSFKFVINTRGTSVIFIPTVDGIPGIPQSYSTTTKSTVEYFFLSDTVGIDIGGTIVGTNPFEFYGSIVPQTVEQLPDRLLYYKIPNTNLGSTSRKRFINYAFTIDTRGGLVNFFILIDDVNVVPFTDGITTNGKETFIFYFIDEQIGTDIGGYLIADGSTPFEFYGLEIQKCISEEMPTPVEYLVIPANDYGKPNRKRHTSYKFQINTRGMDVEFIPIIDGSTYASKIFNTTKKATVEYFFQSDAIGIDIGGIITSTLSGNPFEFYGAIVPQTIEVLPDQLTFYRPPNINLNSISRKRLITLAFVLDTSGVDVVFTPFLDGNTGIPQTFNTTGKVTVIYYFLQETIATDIGMTFLSATTPFEFYGLDLSKCVSEEMPAPCEFLVIPANNYGTPNRKRHTSYKFQINTRGGSVNFIPILDGVQYPLQVFTTLQKQTVEYFFLPADIIGIDIGGILSSNNGIPFEFYGTVVPQTVEQLPDRLRYLRVPNTNLGSVSRKRIINYAFVIDTVGFPVVVTILVDGVSSLVESLTTTGKETQIFYFQTETIGTDIGAIVQSSTLTPFEFYQVVLDKIISEEMPTPCEYLVIPGNDYGKPNRKRHSSYKFQINTRGGDVIFIPIIDGASGDPMVFNTTVKQTIEYFFEDDTIGKDIGGTLSSGGSGIPFEFYGAIVPQTVELLPDRLEFLRIPNTNLNSVSRKRLINYAFVIDTYGMNVMFTPILDNVPGIPQVVNTNGKDTFIYYFLSETILTDIGGTLGGTGNIFEFYGLNPEKIVSEDMPVPCKFLVIPANNYGTPNRKRHTSYKFQINTRGMNVLFTPILDGLTYTPTVFNTSIKLTVEYFFPLGDIIGIDVGGTLQSQTDTPFEFYGMITPQTVEQLPDRLEFLRTPNTNFGIAAPKRVRTLPIVIDTYGNDVTYTPIVDGVVYPSTVLNTLGKITTFHYFNFDSFGTDYGGTFNGINPFEFYSYGQPENVETLPVAKKFDQVGPLRLDKIAKIFTIRVRLITTGTTTMMPYAIFGSNVATLPTQQNPPLVNGIFAVLPNTDELYEIQLPQSINTDVVRVTFGPVNDPFHRYDVKIRVQQSGMDTDGKWEPVR